MIPARAVLPVLLLVAGPALAQETAHPSRPYDPRPESYRSPSGHSPSGASGAGGAATGHLVRSAEVAIGDDTFWLRLQHPVFGEGLVLGDFFAGENDDYAGSLKLMRYGSPWDGPLRLGVGLGGYGVWPDEDGDPAVYALTLCAAANYRFRTAVPFSVGADCSYAPDGTTYNDGDELLDAVARVEVEISSFAAAFVGYRYFTLDLEDDEVDEHRGLDDGVHVGVRLAF